MKILITGSTGFIGNHVIREILNNYKFKVISTSRDKEKAEKIDWFQKVKYINCDLNHSKENFFKFFEEPDLLIHLAWEGLPNFKEPYHFERNLYTNYNFLKNMMEHGLNNLSVLGTCFEYGMRNGCLSEDLIPNPNTAYGLAKDTLRKFIEELNKKYKINFKWIRLFYLYGEGQSPKSILPQIDKALDNNEAVFNMSSGEQLRDYLPVEKVAEYIVKLSIQNKFNGIFNCCSGEPISIRKLVENHMLKRNKSIKLNLGYYPYPDYEPLAFWGDNSKLRKILNEQS